MSESVPIRAEVPQAWGEPRTRELTWYSQESVHAQASSISGLEYLTGVREGTWPPPPIAAITGIELASIAHGEVVLRCAPNESWLNSAGTVHGGLLCTLMDSAMGMSVISTREEMSNAYVSIEMKVSFLKPLPFDGRVIETRGRVLRVGRKVAFAEAHCYDPDGVLVGHATSSLAALA